MTTTVANVLQGVPKTTGGVLIGTSGATLPTTTIGTTTGFTALGYVGDAGLTETNARTTSKLKAWGSDVVKVVQSEFSVTYSFTLIETLNAAVLKAVYGDANVSTTAATVSDGTIQSVSVNGATMVKLPWVFDMIDGIATTRIVVPLGQVTSVGDITYTDGTLVGYPVTIEAFADTSGNNAYKYFDDGVHS